MSDKTPLVVDGGMPREMEVGESVGVSHGGTGGTNKTEAQEGLGLFVGDAPPVNPQPGDVWVRPGPAAAIRLDVVSWGVGHPDPSEAPPNTIIRQITSETEVYLPFDAEIGDVVRFAAFVHAELPQNTVTLRSQGGVQQRIGLSSAPVVFPAGASEVNFTLLDRAGGADEWTMSWSPSVVGGLSGYMAREWHNETANRTSGVVYRNTKPYPIEVSISLKGRTSNVVVLRVEDDNAVMVDVCVFDTRHANVSSPGTNFIFPMTATVLTNRGYTLVGGVPTIHTWAEMY